MRKVRFVSTLLATAGLAVALAASAPASQAHRNWIINISNKSTFDFKRSGEAVPQAPGTAVTLQTENWTTATWKSSPAEYLPRGKSQTVISTPDQDTSDVFHEFSVAYSLPGEKFPAFRIMRSGMPYGQDRFYIYMGEPSTGPSKLAVKYWRSGVTLTDITYEVELSDAPVDL